MSTRLPQRCNEPGCNERTTARGGYCTAHQNDNCRTRRHRDAVAEESWRRWYSLAIWQRIKANFRARFPERAALCQTVDELTGERCAKPATDIDHIKPHRGDWNLFCGGIDYENLQGLCRAHHSKKSAREGPWGER
jgi:5-methylcytosine-specific restriction protein A